MAAADDGWRVDAETTAFRFAEDLMNGPHEPGTGHGHLYVGDMKIGRMLGPTAFIGALPAGTHEVRVTLNSNDHRPLVVDGAPLTATATIQVDE